MTGSRVIVDGNEAAAHVAYLTSEVIAIYPITPASPMGELSDAWADAGKRNLWDAVPRVIEMQSEGGAAGAVHGSLQAGALTTTFTASQGLLLMIPNMFKIAGELTSTVFHVAARSVATHALSIFGDHSDVMAARSTGWAMLASASVQEAQDMALISLMATLASRVPFLHFFDGFRTSHELSKIDQLALEDIGALVDDRLVEAHRARALNPARPALRGTAQNPDVFFQAREASNRFYDAVPAIVGQAMDRFAARVGRAYRIFDYTGAADAERVLVAMGSGIGAAEEAVEALCARGEKVGLVKVRLFRPFDDRALVAVLPKSTRSIAVLDRTKEPGATGEPLYQDVVMSLVQKWSEVHGTGSVPRVIGGRYGLSSKEFTPAMAKAVLDELARPRPKNHFTIGIIDDVTHTSLDWDREFSTEPADVTRAVFYGLGSDGTVGANKNSAKIIGENTALHAQGYFVYDSKKSGATTVSHLRFGPRPIRSSYLISRAEFVACHQFNFLERMDVLELAAPGATLLLNSPHSANEVWDFIPREVQQTIIDKKLRLFVIDGDKVAREAGLPGRVNTIMQTCFFQLSGVLPPEQAIIEIKRAIKKTYEKRGEAIVNRNFAAVDAALLSLQKVPIPDSASGRRRFRLLPLAEGTPDFIGRVTGTMIAGRGELLPVSALPVDGTFPTATAKYEKRSIAQEIPIWDADICIQCGLCAIVCPHAAIRTKAFPEAALAGAPASFVARDWRGTELPKGIKLTVQVAPDDCTGCGVCVEVCPARSKQVAKHKAINMETKVFHLENERCNYDFFLKLPEIERSAIEHDQVKTSMLLEPLFEYSGACAGCGETPYLKLLSQLFGSRMVVANATGCSSIYGGNLPTTPWSTDAKGHGPAWSNSLFEDNAEFGLGMRLALDQQRSLAERLLTKLAHRLGDDFTSALLSSPQREEAELRAQTERVERLKLLLAGIDEPEARRLLAVADALVDRSVWIIGGDGWAYDIGFGGLDHVLASGHNVNILVLDTEVYSNTGGQASKATPRAAVAKFASGGKAIGKKDLGMLAMAYGNVYVAQIAIGAQPKQTIRALLEAEAYPGPSLIIAYSSCIAHGIEMSNSMGIQKKAVQSGYWPLFRFVPDFEASGHPHPFHLDSHKPALPFRDYALEQARFAVLMRSNPARARELFALAQKDIDERWRYYEQLANVERSAPRGAAPSDATQPTAPPVEEV
jgi:pyruvate-ferredoxin/flavodoxin oxidoreductase